MRHLFSFLVPVTLILGTATLHADIFRWDNGRAIPGTEGIVLGPGVDLSGWNSDERNLRYGIFRAPYVSDLTGANFSGSWLDNSYFWSTRLCLRTGLFAVAG